MGKIDTKPQRQRCDKCGGVTKLLNEKGAWHDCDKCNGEGYVDVVDAAKKRDK